MPSEVMTPKSTSRTASYSQEQIDDEAGLHPSMLRDATRPWLLKVVNHDITARVVPFQRFFGVTRQHDKPMELWEDRSQPLWKRILFGLASFYFAVGVFVGFELFYITFLPYLVWNVDTHLARSVVAVWVTVMYIGQAIKDIYKLPRPLHRSGDVVALETIDAEYGFPSTHVMCITAESVTVLMYLHNASGDGWVFGAWVAVAIALVAATFFGRVYYGVHSFPDVIGGFAIALVLIAAYMQVDARLLAWLVDSPASIYMPSVITILMLYVYPRPSYFSTTVADTAIVLGVGNGVLMTAHLQRVLGLPTILLPWATASSMWAWFALTLMRSMFGFLILALTRAVFKAAMMGVMAAIAPKSTESNDTRYIIVVPTKFVTYTAVGFAASLVVPLILQHPMFTLFATV